MGLRQFAYEVLTYIRYSLISLSTGGHYTLTLVGPRHFFIIAPVKRLPVVAR